MDIAEFKEKRIELEKNLAVAIQNLTAQFNIDTGLPVESVYVDIARLSSHGEPDRYVVIGTKVDVDI